jgi:hypothetical protein
MTRDATDRQRDRNVHEIAEATNNRGDLFGELVGVRHHERLGLFAIRIYTAQEADCEGSGLTGP